MSESRIFLSPPHMGGGEQRWVGEAFASNYVAPVGPLLEQFEKAFAERIGIPHCVAVSSGTAAMHLVLRHLGVGQGDTVVASTLTFIGSVSPAVQLGATPVFVDADSATWNMDPLRLENALVELRRGGQRIKAVIPTDLYGQSSDLDRIIEICRPFGIPVICDSAEAVGTTYKGRHAGAGAMASVYSFNGNKIITTSGGGMLASHDAALIAHARKLATQAREPVSHYEHTELGYNYRLSNVLAGIGLGQLEVLDQRVAQKRALFDQYQTGLAHLPGVSFIPEAAYGRSNRWLTVLLLDPDVVKATPAELCTTLEALNIEARPLWKPMHLQPVFTGCEYFGGTVAETLFARGVCLPSGTAMMEADVVRVCAAVEQTLKRATR